MAMNEIELEILDLLDSGYTDEQIIGSLIRNYPIESSEARATLAEVLPRWLHEEPEPVPPIKWREMTWRDCNYSDMFGNRA